MAKEKIYTIPLKDVYADLSTCPFCQMDQKLEEDALHYYLGPALMEADVRTKTNQSGFCKDHLEKLYESGENRLGLALTLNTHLKALQDILDGALKALEEQKPGSWMDKLRTQEKNRNDAEAEKIQNQLDACVICERLALSRAQYMDICFHLLLKDSEFELLFYRCSSYCLPHIRMLMAFAKKHLPPGEQKDFFRKLRAVVLPALRTLTDDVQWFAEKFDYRNKEAPWKNSKDALPRSIQYLGVESKKEGKLTKG